MTRGELIDLVLNSAAGGVENTEVDIEFSDIETMLPNALAYATSLLQQQDVRSYRFDRVSFFKMTEPPLVRVEKEVSCLDDVLFINIPLKRQSDAMLRVTSGLNLVPIFESKHSSVAGASLIPVYGYKIYKDSTVDLIFSGIPRGGSVYLEYQADVTNMGNEIELPYTGEVLYQAINILKDFFFGVRAIPDDEKNDGVDDINKRQ